MKKHAKTLKRFVAMALSVLMVISLFPNGALRAFAEELADAGNKTVLDFVPEGAQAEQADMNYQVVYIKNNETPVYANYEYGAEGAVYKGAQGEQIELSDSYTYSVDGEEVVLYRYYSLEDAVMKSAQLAGFGIISEKCI